MVTTNKKTKKLHEGQIGVRVDADLKKELDTIAQAEERTLAQLARLALKQFVERRKAEAV